MCWILFCWMVASLMFARTCWLQVPPRTLYSIIRDMCDCRVSRIRPTLRMPLVCMRISPIRLDLLSTAFCVLDKIPHRESWTWALSLSFAIKICNKIYILITFLVCYSMFKRSTLCTHLWRKILCGASSVCSRTSMRSMPRRKNCPKIGFLLPLRWVFAYLPFFLFSFLGWGKELDMVCSKDWGSVPSRFIASIFRCLRANRSLFCNNLTPYFCIALFTNYCDWGKKIPLTFERT